MINMGNIECLCGVRVMVFNATFNNIFAISWRSVLLLEETGVPGEYHRPAASHRQTLSDNVASRMLKYASLTNKCREPIDNARY